MWNHKFELFLLSFLMFRLIFNVFTRVFWEIYLFLPAILLFTASGALEISDPNSWIQICICLSCQVIHIWPRLQKYNFSHFYFNIIIQYPSTHTIRNILFDYLEDFPAKIWHFKIVQISTNRMGQNGSMKWGFFGAILLDLEHLPWSRSICP